MEPEEIEGRQFGATLRGYDRQEVEDFIKEVAAHVRDLQKDLALTRAALEAAKAEPPPQPAPQAGPPADPPKAEAFKQLGEQTARILISAEQAGNEIKGEAKREAAEVLADARRDAGRIARQARENKQRAEGDLRQLVHTRAMLAEQLEEVRRRLAEVVSRLQAPLDIAPTPPVHQTLPDAMPWEPPSAGSAPQSTEGDHAGSSRESSASPPPQPVRPAAEPARNGSPPARPSSETVAGGAPARLSATDLQNDRNGGREESRTKSPAEETRQTAAMESPATGPRQSGPAEVNGPAASHPTPMAEPAKTAGGETQKHARPPLESTVDSATATAPAEDGALGLDREGRPAGPHRKESPGAAEPGKSPNRSNNGGKERGVPAPPGKSTGGQSSESTGRSRPRPSQDIVERLLEEIREDSMTLDEAPPELVQARAPQKARTVQDAPGATPVSSATPAPGTTTPARPSNPSSLTASSVSSARSAGSTASPVASSSVSSAPAVSPPASAPAPSPGRKRANVSQPAGEEEAAFFSSREQALSHAPYDASRKLKRLLQEEHNDLLHRLRLQRGRGTAAENIAPEEDQVARFNELLGQILLEAFRQGRRAAGGEPSAGLPDSVASLVARQVVVPLRQELSGVIETGLASGDTASAISERASDVFRVWKGVRTELIAEGLVYAAFHEGLSSVWSENRRKSKRWILSPEEQQCPNGICEANASQGPMPVSGKFSSGHTIPPAHGGCTCGLLSS